MLKRFDIVQIKMTGEELRDVTLASSGDLKKICPYFNVGFCRYRDHCKHIHPSENCGEKDCSGKNCRKRHRKPCRYGEHCSRMISCEFLHQKQRRPDETDADLKAKQESLDELIKIKDDQILELTKKIELLETNVAKIKEETERFKTVEEKVDETEAEVTRDIKIINTKLKTVLKEIGFIKDCGMCGDVVKSERQLKNHQREKHDGMVLNSMGHVVHKDSMWAF